MTSDALRERLEKEYGRIRRSEKEIRAAVRNELSSAGYACCACAKCCRREDGDNTVFVRPAEVGLIAAQTGLAFDEIAAPLFPDIYDITAAKKAAVSSERAAQVLEQIADQIAPDGRVRTFGWMLRRRDDGSCRFLGEDKKCAIYGQRPLLCRTYPFYLDEGRLTESECEGLGTKKMTADLCRELAGDLTDRYLYEMEDMIRTYDQIRSRLPDDGGSPEGLRQARRNLENGIIRFVVYDSCGVTESAETFGDGKNGGHPDGSGENTSPS